MTQSIKWREVFSLLFLNISVVISWIAYHEYQPVLVESFGIQYLAKFVIYAKVIILIVIPPLASYLTDKYLIRTGRNFVIFTSGISLTALVFMTVATIVGFGPTGQFANLLPVMIVLWLISMNIFHSPANSLIELFAPNKDLIKVTALLFAFNELIYALEPLVVIFITFLGGPLTFVTGGVLIASSGFIFYRITTDEILQKSQIIESNKDIKFTTNKLFYIAFFTLTAGFAHSLLLYFIPNKLENLSLNVFTPEYYSFFFLFIAAIVSAILFFFSKKINQKKFINFSILLVLLTFPFLYLTDIYSIIIICGVIFSISFSLISINGLPYIFNNVNPKYVTLIIGIYFGLLEVFDGLFEIMNLY